MEIDILKESLSQYESQISQVDLALSVTHEGEEYESLLSLRTDLQELIDLTNENIQKLTGNDVRVTKSADNEPVDNDKLCNDKHENVLDDEYALFMAEMSKSGAYDKADGNDNDEIQANVTETENATNVDIEVYSKTWLK